MTKPLYNLTFYACDQTNQERNCTEHHSKLRFKLYGFYSLYDMLQTFGAHFQDPTDFFSPGLMKK